MINIKRWKSREKVHAVDDDSLFKTLKTANIISNASERFNCYVCNREITIKDIGALIIVNKTLCIVCDNFKCQDDAFSGEKYE